MEEEYQKEKEAFLSCRKEEQDQESKMSKCKDPIIYKEINTPLGECFYLYTREQATTEQKFQGIKITYNQ